ncbi:hypothetical protein SLS57_005404 [Botryosphaeria dothidea]
MVTTRRGADTQSPQVASATRATRKRFNDDSATSTPIRNTKKRRSNSAEEQSSQEEDVSKLDLTKDSTAEDSAPDVSTPVRRSVRGRPRKGTNASQDATPETPVAEKEDEQPQAGDTPMATPNDDASVYGTPAGEDTPSVYATPATNLRPGLRSAACPCPNSPSLTPRPRTRGAKSTPSKPSRLASSQTVEAEDEEATPKAESRTVEEAEGETPEAEVRKEETIKTEEPTEEAPQAAEKQLQEETAKAAEPKAGKSKAEEPAPISKKTHIRFGSEDPPVMPEPAPEPPRQEIPSSSFEEEDSDDDAPEAVTASSAREQARVAEEETAKAIEKQDNEAKRKRQEREARLREQAAAAKKRKQEYEPKQIPADVASSATIQASDPAALRKLSRPSFDPSNLPALLPDDILAAAPEVRPATPESDDEQTGAATSKKEIVNKHLKFLDEKPPKDVKKGPVKVRVLEKGNKLLPPKVSNSGTKSVRDQWLQGRKAKEGKKGSFGGLERKKLGGGFLRR